VIADGMLWMDNSMLLGCLTDRAACAQDREVC
jgi:hypothetical protein